MVKKVPEKILFGIVDKVSMFRFVYKLGLDDMDKMYITVY